MIKILIIGCGPHATHFYLPQLQKMMLCDANITVSGVLDLTSAQQFVTEELKRRSFNVKTFFISPFKCGNDVLSQEAEVLLNGLVDSGEVNAVIISTDPLNHKSYARWALSRHLPILLDKPVTTRENATFDLAQAKQIEQDYEDLLADYQKQPSPRKPFVLCAHRRYHPGILEVRRIIRETSLATSCPVTNVHSMHADGQWRLPTEICEQKHHSYNEGYGKVSHSGFHFIDCVVEFWKEGLCPGKRADALEVFSRFIRPKGLLKQLTHEDYAKLFGPDYETVCKYSDEALSHMFETCGEVDAEINLAMLANNEPFSLGTISLMHNSYSQRSWVHPNRDLYKGNGRVKHEEHVINIGPFLNIQVHSYQSKDNHTECDSSDLEPGGNNHFEIYLFRNNKIIGGKAFEKISLADLPAAKDFSQDSLFISQIKRKSIEEWIEAIRKGIGYEAGLLSNFTDHRMAVALMSAIYQSNCQRENRQSPIITIPWR